MITVQEWREGLRSSLHPLLFAGVYRVAAHINGILGLSIGARSAVLLAAPKLLQACFAAAMDYATYKLASQTYGHGSRAAYAALALTVLSPWQAFCSVRTLSNSLETTLTIVALSLWPWESFAVSNRSLEYGPNRTNPATAGKSGVRGTQHSSKSLYQSLAAAALACILRPTNIIVWATASVTLLLQYGSRSKLVMLAQAALLSGGAVLAVSVSADRVFYEEWVLPPFRFLQFNLVQSLAVFYGKNRPDYYLTEGLPLLLTTALPFGAVGLYQALRAKPSTTPNGERLSHAIRFTLGTAVITSVLALSLISHKEVRFIYPLLPMLHILAAKPLASFFAPFPRPKHNLRRMLIVLMVAINLFIAWYTLFVHQRGVIDVLHYLQKQHERRLTESSRLDKARYNPGATGVYFLMPCHSTPWRSHLIHTGIHAHALTCEPPLNLTVAERETYMDEADVFYDDPTAWILNNLVGGGAEREPGLEYLVFFEELEDQLISLFKSGDYEYYDEVWRGFNTHWHDDSRRDGDVIVWRKIPIREEL